MVFIITPENNGGILVRHSKEENNVGKKFLCKKKIFLLNAKITEGHCKTSINVKKGVKNRIKANNNPNSHK